MMESWDHDLLADALRKDNAPAHTVGAIARALQLDNPRFDHKRFMKRRADAGRMIGDVRITHETDRQSITQLENFVRIAEYRRWPEAAALRVELRRRVAEAAAAAKARREEAEADERRA